MEAALWSAIGAIAALVVCAITFVAFWMTLGQRITAADMKADSAATLAAASVGKAELLATEFSNHRESVAHNLGRMEALAQSSSSSIVEAEKRLTRAIDNMGERFDGMSERLDRALDRGVVGKSS